MNWSNYYNLTKNTPPHRSLIKTLRYLKNKDIALDIGSGGLRDSKYLITKFKKVTAIDKIKASDIPKKLEFKKVSFEKFIFPVNKYDLVNAQFSLPFLPKKIFLKVWRKLEKSLKQNGIFIGQFFGDKDEWVGNNYSFFNKKEVKELLKNFKILKFDEIKKKNKLAGGSIKKWHYFEVVIRKQQ